MKTFDFVNGSTKSQYVDRLDTIHKNEEFKTAFFGIEFPLPGFHLRTNGKFVFGYYISEYDRDVAENAGITIGGNEDTMHENGHPPRIAIIGRLKECDDGCHIKGVILPSLLSMFICLSFIVMAAYQLCTDAEISGYIIFAIGIMFYGLIIWANEKRIKEAYELLEELFG
ncbi:MAG: hypothetical protein NC122_08950 [Faecalibacterium sp.]|nr:hypothetical protein [Ruminococcus sp.]MCM1486322.1 hypothetical protein [Faecalibacterium sp.]